MGLRLSAGSFNAASIQDGARSEQSLKAAMGAGMSYYVTDIIIAGGAAGLTVQVRDGSADKAKIVVAANASTFLTFKVPLQIGDNKALTVTSGASTGSSVIINGFKDRYVAI